MRKVFTPVRVGLLVIASSVALFVFLTFVRKGGLSSKQAMTVFAIFHDASGLSQRSRVQVAGITVGEVLGIELQKGLAKITLRIRRDVQLRQDAGITKRSESLLGDYLLDIYPGSENAPLMEDGGEIKKVIDTQGMEAVFNSLGKITADIQAVTKSLRESLTGEGGEGSMGKIVQNLVKVSETVEKMISESTAKLDLILDNVEAATGDVRMITSSQEQRVALIVENVAKVTSDARDVTASIKQIIGSQEGDLKGTVASLRETIGRLDKSLSNIEEVTEKVKSGHGVVGTLLSDERAGQRLAETIDDASDFISRLTRLQVEVGLRSEYLVSQGASKNALGFRLIPKPDKYYLIEFIADPRGAVEIQTVQRNPPDTGQPVTQQLRITRDTLKLSAQFAKRYYFTTLRFGIIESTGGVGADFHFLEDALTLKLDAFNFSVPELRWPRLRASIRVQAFQHIFATAGIDDIFNRQVRESATNRLIAGRDVYFGGGIFFTDDDLKAVLTAAPSIRP
jgi:phospholipid/cholesterol/gamma-HCH transport system substrate-binding protein